MQNPSVGRDVHYVSHGTPSRPDGTQAYESACRAAKITQVNSDGTVGLCVINPTGLFFQESVPANPACKGLHDSRVHRYCPCGWIEARYDGGTWHWPERV